MSRRARLTIAAVLALISAVGIVVVGVQLVAGGDARAQLPSGFRATAATAPFAGYRETRVEINGRCRPVALADTASRRAQGLRGRAELGEYAGMLFVDSRDSATAFTMAEVTQPLEISWYSANGARLDGAHLTPCPNRDDAHCPVYRSTRRYRLALETPGGSPVTGSIAPC